MPAQELARLIDEGLCSLPSVTRLVFELHRYDEKNLAEIAHELRLDIRVVEQHLSAALLHIHGVIHGRQ